MFTINQIQNPKKIECYLELKNSEASCYAKIDLMLGGSLQELRLGNKTLISSENMPAYHTAFMSSILFPFANRIENGKYSFNNKNYELYKNEADRHNALHGLVYDKTFQFISQTKSTNKTSIVLSYDETQPYSGFPFKYNLTLEYVLSENSLELNVKIKNNDQHAFPFSLGWHPYFKTNDLYNTYLSIYSNKKILVNDKMIPNGEEIVNWNSLHKIEDKTFDDCYVLNTNSVELKTPEYHLEFQFSSEKNYLQLYTPNSRNSIAIEPQTAPANSFNTGMGLQILQPNDGYDLSWKINLKKSL